MSKAKLEQSETSQRGSSYVFEALEQFIERHLAEGHDIRMFLDRNGNSYSIFCIKCDPRMAELTETHH
jgi:primosomal protein N'